MLKKSWWPLKSLPVWCWGWTRGFKSATWGPYYWAILLTHCVRLLLPFWFSGQAFCAAQAALALKHVPPRPCFLSFLKTGSHPVIQSLTLWSSCPLVPASLVPGTTGLRCHVLCAVCMTLLRKWKYMHILTDFFDIRLHCSSSSPPSPVRCLSLSLQGFRRFLDIDIQVWDLSSILWTHTIEEENQLLLTSTDRLCTSDPILTHKTSVNKCNFKNEKVQGLHWPRPVGFLWGANLPHRTLLGHYRAERLVCQDANYHIKTVCSSSKCPHKHLTG